MPKGAAARRSPIRTCHRACSRRRKCRFPASCSTIRSCARSWRTTTRRCGGPTIPSAQILAALKASGQAERTVVMFLSDHGMPLPFAKTQLYHHSTHTPLDRPLARRHASRRGGRAAHGLGRRFAADAAGHRRHRASRRAWTAARSRRCSRASRKTDRDMVVKEYNENAGGSRDPMRAIQTKQFLYIFNPWSNGQRIMQTATTGTPTYRRLRELAATDPAARRPAQALSVPRRRGAVRRRARSRLPAEPDRDAAHAVRARSASPGPRRLDGENGRSDARGLSAAATTPPFAKPMCRPKSAKPTRGEPDGGKVKGKAKGKGKAARAAKIDC